jgi:Las17-binding protein actin regulator
VYPVISGRCRKYFLFSNDRSVCGLLLIPSTVQGAERRDIIAYAKKKGAFVGVSLEGAVIAVSDDSNNAYLLWETGPADRYCR